jgi:hypothetical protein
MTITKGKPQGRHDAIINEALAYVIATIDDLIEPTRADKVFRKRVKAIFRSRRK